MPKNKKGGPVRKGGASASESLAIRSLLCGFAAELYLFIIRRYASGTAMQMVAWNERYLPILLGVGAAILAVSAIWIGVQRGDPFKRTIGLYLGAAGLFMALVSALGIWDIAFFDRLIVLVPIATLLGIVWGLYDRECAVSLTALGVGISATWLFSRSMQPFSPFLTVSRVLAVLLLIALAALFYLLWKGNLKNFLRGGDSLLLYVSFALTFAGILASLVSVGAARYAMWALALAAFGLAVYYTVKQI